MPFKTGPRTDCHILRWLLDFVMSKTTPLAAPEKSSIFAHLCRSPQVTDSVSDTIPQAEVRATKGRARVEGSRRLHDSPRPASNSTLTGRKKPRPPHASGSHHWLTDTRQVSSRRLLAHCPISQARQDSGRWEGKESEEVEWEWD